jgi:hypothetical protein
MLEAIETHPVIFAGALYGVLLLIAKKRGL